MKRFDGYSIRGVVFGILGLAGLGYEIFSSASRSIFVIVLYSFVVILGVLLCFVIKAPPEKTEI